MGNPLWRRWSAMRKQYGKALHEAAILCSGRQLCHNLMMRRQMIGETFVIRAESTFAT